MTCDNAVELYIVHIVNQKFEPAPDLARGRIRRHRAYDNTLYAVKGPEVARKYTYQFDIKDKNVTRNELENKI